jgi:hypothetical protein
MCIYVCLSPCASYFENPLASRDGDEYVLHFYDMAARKPYALYRFCKVVG